MTMALMIGVAIFLLALLLWLLFSPRKMQGEPSTRALEIKKLLPVHCRNFPQVQRILKPADEKFLRIRASKRMVRQWRADRTRVLRLYARGLEQDFRHLQELVRVISALSPELKRRQEWELLALGFQFQLLYRVTLVRLAVQGLPFRELPHLTEIVAKLGLDLEQSLDRIIQSVPQVGITTG